MWLVITRSAAGSFDRPSRPGTDQARELPYRDICLSVGHSVNKHRFGVVQSWPPLIQSPYSLRLLLGHVLTSRKLIGVARGGLEYQRRRHIISD